MRRGGSEGVGGGGSSAKPRKPVKDERTKNWGSSLITFSTKLSGVTVVQGTCHRKCSHRNLLGKASTVCRQTYTVTDDHSEADCENLCKLFIGNAKNYNTRRQHQAKRYGLDELPDDLSLLEYMRPPSDYDSEEADGADVGAGFLAVADAPAPGPAIPARGRGRGRGLGQV